MLLWTDQIFSPNIDSVSLCLTVLPQEMSRVVPVRSSSEYGRRPVPVLYQTGRQYKHVACIKAEFFMKNGIIWNVAEGYGSVAPIWKPEVSQHEMKVFLLTVKAFTNKPVLQSVDLLDRSIVKEFNHHLIRRHRILIYYILVISKKYSYFKWNITCQKTLKIKSENMKTVTFTRILTLHFLVWGWYHSVSMNVL